MMRPSAACGAPARAHLRSTHSILVVEDDPTSRRLLASLLVEMGYDVTSAAGGEEALRYLYSEQTCDAVISDMIMPGMSGIELAARARDARPGLPVVFVTGKPDALELSIRVGSLALCKPVTRERLDGILQDALESHTNAVRKPLALRE